MGNIQVKHVNIQVKHVQSVNLLRNMVNFSWVNLLRNIVNLLKDLQWSKKIYQLYVFHMNICHRFQ